MKFGWSALSWKRQSGTPDIVNRSASSHSSSSTSSTSDDSMRSLESGEAAVDSLSLPSSWILDSKFSLELICPQGG